MTEANPDMLVKCPECDGFGTVEGYTAKPWDVGKQVECERCRGWGEIAVETDEP